MSAAVSAVASVVETEVETVVEAAMDTTERHVDHPQRLLATAAMQALRAMPLPRATTRSAVATTERADEVGSPAWLLT